MIHAFSQQAEHSDYLLTFKENGTTTTVKTFKHNLTILGIKVLDVLLKGWWYLKRTGAGEIFPSPDASRSHSGDSGNLSPPQPPLKKQSQLTPNE